MLLSNIILLWSKKNNKDKVMADHLLHEIHMTSSYTLLDSV